MNTFLKSVAWRAMALVAVLVVPVGAAEPVKVAARTSHDLLGEGVAILGYDPVSYFPEGGGKAGKGHIMISAEHEGVTYRFANEEHKALFLKSPGKYTPAYGGWCTWAVAELNKRVDVDPEAYVVRNGKLYLFYRDPLLDTRAKFQESPDAMLSKAEANWPALAK